MGAAVAWDAEPSDDPYAETEARFDALLRMARSPETQRMSHSEWERLLAEEGQKLLRQLYEDRIAEQAQAEVSEPVVDAQGCERTRKRPQRRELETIFGTVEVTRTGYGAVGEASLHPLDGQLNLPDERYSLEVRRRAALEASKGSFEEAVQTLKRLHRGEDWQAAAGRTGGPSGAGLCCLLRTAAVGRHRSGRPGAGRDSGGDGCRAC